MTAKDSKFYLVYFNKLVDQYNKIYHHSIDRKPIDAGYAAFSEGTETNPKAPKFKVGDRIRITN